jgi:8-oxo-dGTP pyrophosphatase MutT (NUDIX family)
MPTRQFIRGRTIFLLSMIVKALIRPVLFGASAVVEDAEGRVLLVRHSYMAGWALPGGGVGRGEPPEAAVLRELKEEVGLSQSAAPELIGLYSRKLLWFANIIALYRVRDARIAFRPNLEIREIMFCDPASPPPNTQLGTSRRLSELAGRSPPSPYW